MPTDNDKVLSAETLDQFIIFFERWAKVYHIRRPEVEAFLLQALEGVVYTRIALYGQPPEKPK